MLHTTKDELLHEDFLPFEAKLLINSLHPMVMVHCQLIDNQDQLQEVVESKITGG
jgi:hypothetical protein